MTFRGYKIQAIGVVTVNYYVTDKNHHVVHVAPTQLSAMQWIEGATK